MQRRGDALRRWLVAVIAAAAVWCGASLANSQSAPRDDVVAPLSPADQAIASDSRTAAPFPELSLRAPIASPELGLEQLELPTPSFKLSPELIRLRGWHKAPGPFGEAAALLAEIPKVIVIATLPDRRMGTWLTLQCYPARCGAIVLARF
jgi:hypothetical protein